MKDYKYIKIAAFIGALAVIIGAFGAHALAPHMNDVQVQNYKTASMYHFVHALLLMVLGFFHLSFANKVIQQSFTLVFLGIIFFSGSLYILSIKPLIGGDIWNILGPVTPIGGLLLILGWLNLLRLKN